MAPLESADPERIGRYRLVNRLGSGGMGQVFLGRSAGGRAVAIKRIHPHMAADASFRERFAREVTAARQVSGAFTAPVIDAGPDDEVPWLVTSYVPSLPLDEALQAHGPLPEASVHVLAAGLAEALTEIHRVGLIHRDLKPGNVLLSEDGPRVIDFGIARATDGTAATQSVIGTPGFMSPEQVQGEALGPASDLFAYGAVLAFAATGTGPFGEGSMPTMVMRIISREPDLSGVPESLRHLVAACLSKDASGRPSPGEILDYLGDVPAGTSWLPPSVMRGVQEQVAKVNQALAGSASDSQSTGGHRRTEVLGAGGAAAVGGAAGAAAGAAAAGALGDDQATRIAPAGGTQAPGAGEYGATSVMGAQGQGHQPTAQGQGYQPTAQFPATRQQPGTPPTAQYGQAQQGQGQYGQGQAQYGQGQHGQGQYGQGQYAQRARPGDDDPYAGLYEPRGGADTAGYQQQEQQRRMQAEQARAQQQAEEQRRRAEQQRQMEEQRRQEAERVHRERLRAEQEATRRAQAQARHADQPGVWGFVKLLPLLILPLVQIPLGYGASLAWEWFTTETQVWNGSAFAFEPLSMAGFWSATMLGYFLFNNLVSLEFLVRSLRTVFVTGAVLALSVIAATNFLLYGFGFWG